MHNAGLSTICYRMPNVKSQHIHKMPWSHAQKSYFIENQAGKLQYIANTKISGTLTHCGHWNQNKRVLHSHINTLRKILCKINLKSLKQWNYQDELHLNISYVTFLNYHSNIHYCLKFWVRFFSKRKKKNCYHWMNFNICDPGPQTSHK